MPPRRPTRCSYREGNRRCPYDGDGEPKLCRAHRIAVAEASRPRPPREVLLEALRDLLSGKQIDTDATLTAATTTFFEQVSKRSGAEYRPSVESGWHRQAQPGQGKPWGQHNAPPPVDPDIEVQRVARAVMGFSDKETLIADQIKDRKRVLAKRHHPDRGGSVEMMARVNDAADVLLAFL